VDLYAPGGGDLVRAVADGVVTTARYQGTFGNLVTLEHPGGISTLYGHLRDFLVTDQQRVTRGTPLGHMGSTGQSTGVHLHFEVHIGGRPLDPEKILSAARILEDSQD
jgi:murein DD-endopeptidase MepM/ murein hydrolase activator NlpD